MAFVKSQDMGRTLLDEVREETLAELVSSVQDTNQNGSANKRWLGVSHIDRLIDIFHQRKRSLVSPPVLEVTSVTPAVGKTHLLYLFAILTLLPSLGVGLQNESDKDPRAVVVFDTDGRFDVERLKSVMLTQVCLSLAESNRHDQDANSIVQNALRHVHVFRPQSLGSLVACVQSLPDYLLDFRYHHSIERSLGLVVIDSISAFFWQQNWAEEMSAHANDAIKADETTSSNYSDLIHALEKIQKMFGPVIAATQWGLSPLTSRRSNSSVVSSFRSLLPHSWLSFCTVRFVLQRDHVKRFPSHISYQQAIEESEDRQKVVDQGRFSGWINRSDSEHWDDKTWEVFKSDRRNQMFRFSIVDDSITVFS